MRNWIVETWKKVAGTIKVAAVEHTKVMVITSCVVVAGATGTGVTVATVLQRNNAIQANAETVQETTQEHTTMLPTVTQTTEEATTEEETTEEQTEASEIIAMEDLNIVDMAQAEVAPDGGRDESVDSSSVETKPSEIYEVNDLVHGIDVSFWQGDIDWTAVADSGIRFAIIKCAGRGYGGGSLYEDPKFKQNIQGALANGIQVGIYFFSQAITEEEAIEEASMTINMIRSYQITYPVAIDFESGDGYRQNNISVDERTRICQVFCDKISEYGYQPMIYSCRNDLRDNVNIGALSANYKIWMAQYFNKYYRDGYDYEYGDPLPSPSWNYQIWQYNSKGSVPGISGHVDMNLAFFGYANYKVDNMQDPAITIANDSFTAVAGDKSTEPDIHAGVKAVNCIGYETEYTTHIYNSDGDSIDADVAYASAGIYKITYSFNDPKSGKISKDVTLHVVSPIQLNIKNQTYTTVEGTSVNLRQGLSATDANGKDATSSITYVIASNGVIVDEATAMKTAGDYVVTYSFADSMKLQPTVTKTVTLTVTPKETQSQQPSKDEGSSESVSTKTESSSSVKADEKK